jgi:hypothetical protein
MGWCSVKAQGQLYLYLTIIGTTKSTNANVWTLNTIFVFPRHYLPPFHLLSLSCFNVFYLPSFLPSFLPSYLSLRDQRNAWERTPWPKVTDRLCCAESCSLSRCHCHWLLLSLCCCAFLSPHSPSPQRSTWITEDGRDSRPVFPSPQPLWILCLVSPKTKQRNTHKNSRKQLCTCGGCWGSEGLVLTG